MKKSQMLLAKSIIMEIPIKDLNITQLGIKPKEMQLRVLTRARNLLMSRTLHIVKITKVFMEAPLVRNHNLLIRIKTIILGLVIMLIIIRHREVEVLDLIHNRFNNNK
jgi:hypothetical protein